MKKFIGKTLLVLWAVTVVASCASYRSYLVPEPAKEPYGAQLEGKSLTIKPFTVKFTNSRGLTVGFDYVKLGNVYTKRYAVEENSMTFNTTVGVLQRNILEKAKTNAESLSRIAVDTILAGALGQKDYTLAFMKGLGSGNMGELANRPVEYDQSSTPATVRFLPAQGPVSYFSEVMLINDPGSTEADYYLEGEIHLDNEIQHILGAPSPMYGSFDRRPQQDDYYFLVKGSIYFKLYDARTGLAVVTEKTKLAFPVVTRTEDFFHIPIKDPKAFYDLDSFLALDYSEFAAKAIEKAVMTMFPFISPYTANVQYMEKIEK